MNVISLHSDNRHVSATHVVICRVARRTIQIFISVIKQLDAQYFCFTISLFHASTCFQHMCSKLVHETATYRCDDTTGCVMQFWPPDDERICSKHVEAWNKLIVKQKFCASSWLITEINILRCTVSKTSKNIQIYLKVSDSLHGSNRTVLVNIPVIPVKWWNSDQYKTLEVKNCCPQCGSVGWRTQKRHVVDCDPDWWAMIQSSFVARPITRSHAMWLLCVGSLKNNVHKTENPHAGGTLQRLTRATSVRNTLNSF